MKAERYGWRSKIALLSPAPGITIMREWEAALPEGVTCHQTLMEIKEVTPEGLIELREKAISEAKKFTSSGLMDILLFSCTSGSFIGGPGYDKEIIRDLEKATGIPSTTTSTCVLVAFNDLEVKKIAIIGPYSEEVLDIEIEFFKHHDIQTLYSKGLGYTSPKEINKTSDTPYIYYRLAKEAYNSAPEIDAIFITCMASPGLKIIEILEQETGKAVISSCSASLYGVLKKIEIKDSIEQYGKLLKMHSRGKSEK
jgi:maleate isomerase